MTSYQDLVKRGERVMKHQVDNLDNTHWKAHRAFSRIEAIARKIWRRITP